MIYDTIIIGAGPAGCAAAIYAARKKMKAILITESFGGQSAVSATIENWIGEKEISGFDFARKLEEHVRFQEDLEIKDNNKISKVEKKENVFTVETEQGESFQTKTLIITAGGHHRKLNIPGEEKFDGKGVAYCSTCDAPMFRDREVVVVGSGNAGLEAIVDLLNYSSKIYLLDILSEMQGDKVLQEEILKSDKIQFVSESRIKEIYGDKFVEGIKYTDKENQEKELKVQGVFIEIGSLPNSDFLGDLVEKDKYNQIKVDKNQTTNQPGIFAAGDVTDKMYKQNNIAAGDGTVAILAAYEYLMKFY
ncbi:MAG: FAD-dependent oxidoreductase [Patescibacteria group bacterium]